MLSQNASPHDYALKPSDIQKIQSADLVVWVGSDLEVFLAKPIAKSRRSLALANNENMPLRTFTKPCGCGHKHSHYDPHIWLDPEQAKIIAQSITSELIKISPDLKHDYLSKLLQFNQTLSLTVERIKRQLTPIQHQGYFVFHDAYGYFEDYFELNNLGHFTVHPERPIGAKKLITIKNTIEDQSVQCLFSEPQFTPALVEQTVRGTRAQKGELDPVGSMIAVEKGSYFRFLESIANGLIQCLN
ncbi:High-affinity zinc uptake system protein ZnuA precursor [Vibrio thalassae]|uniref:High-affinity zinc uptake system protein ZnuA n=1 Tax=Vibrio thalassae TaxID=1243014 RepID=A0A240EJW3_9VIBR|nr:zinc ABC transporter substrate-binding protein [Vibrio thalassae]SNX48801.1 High-affinity zinc uptake system protein ZnuA precursor [Vibrio thalassae]